MASCRSASYRQGVMQYIYCDSGQVSHLQVWCDGSVTVAVACMLVVNHCSNIGNDAARWCTLLFLPQFFIRERQQRKTEEPSCIEFWTKDDPKKSSILHTKEGKCDKLTRLLKKAADDQNKDQDLEESSDSDVSSNESEYLGSDDDDVDNYWLWERFVMSCRRGGKKMYSNG